MNYLITDFGAAGDGKTLNTAAIQKAVDDCTSSGGGRVIVPAGRFLSGTICLKSNVDLHLESGAELISSLDPADMQTIAYSLKDFPFGCRQTLQFFFPAFQGGRVIQRIGKGITELDKVCNRSTRIILQQAVDEGHPVLNGFESLL